MRTAVALMVLLTAFGCDGSSVSLMGPTTTVSSPGRSATGSGEPPAANLIDTAQTAMPSAFSGLPAWRPCVVVQSPGGVAEAIQFQAIERLQASGAMTWIRLNAYANGSAQPYYRIASSMGLRIFSIIHLRDLNGLGWNEAFDTIYKLYPETEIFEIAGEVSNPDPFVNEKTTTPADYMQRFKSLYEYVRVRYPHVKLASAPPMGSANGPEELEEFIKLGLLDMDVIVTLNVYTEFALSQYAAVFTANSRAMAQRRVWVTETGSRDPALHVQWVKEMYPKINNSLRPDMVCWYVLWGGDETGEAGKDNGFGLLTGVEKGVYEERPLFHALAGTTGVK